MKKLIPLLFAVASLFLVGGCTMQPVSVPDHNSVLDRSRVLKGSDKFVTPDTFRPPVEITIVAKTDSTNLRMGYAADQVIFNWEVNRDQLRVDGGPADGKHTSGAGEIPAGKYVTIRWLVTPEHQAIYVDDELRFEHCGDYSHIDRPVSVFPAEGSEVTVKSVTVKQLMKTHQTRRTFPGMGVPWSPPKGGITMMWPDKSLQAARESLMP